ncbi:prolyl oligopeptidase family serine peptidase [Streptococcus sobrinus]|uniref:prolyl oligopeptidase family serine peptidase n=2 Tax=Streptococcus sobrinus TaxID=1310 RepID=UPI0002D5753F|nr:prolyl oligopeptidase family serine peptidase [Streptococcus sobrinus]AWN18342.1 lipase [Streptococcus sobrinus]OZV24133.1 lipase [Streptococcus sobrinus]
MSKKKIAIGIGVLALGLLIAAGLVFRGGSKVTIDKVSLGVKGYEFGPAVHKLVVDLDDSVSHVSQEDLSVTTAGVEQKVEKVYLSDANGNPTSKKSSPYVTIQLPVSFDSKKSAAVASPFQFDLDDFHNHWVTDYTVSIKGLKVTKGGKTSTLNHHANDIDNRISTQTDVFNKCGDFTGNYTNPITHLKENLTLRYAAYEPKSLAGGEKKPLLIWLHGQGEGGDDLDVTLLGNEVTALAQKDIQNHFRTGKTKGAYVLAVESPTYWMDEGDGTNGAGSGNSRYTQALMATIKKYVASNPNIDTKRIYLSGGSNGGYMTLNMAVHYPDYFSALVPQSAAYSYYNYERNADGTYKTVESKDSLSGYANVRTDDVYFDADKIAALKDIPIWFVHAENDKVVNPKLYALPVYKALLDSGAKNKWFSFFKSVEGSDMKGTTYNGHWSWTYYFNDKVKGVQDVQKISSQDDLSGFQADNKSAGGTSQAKVAGKTYDNLFDWLNDQHK